jgi:uncharacterized protein YoxC
MRIDVHIHLSRENDAQVLALLQEIKERLTMISPELQKVLDDTTVLRTKTESLITLTNGIAQLIRDKADDKTALLQLATDLETETGAVQTSIDANTDVAPAPPTP